jgi:hypothetical protein
MPLTRLVYYSHNTMPLHGATPILRSAVRNNVRRGVTGGLVSGCGCFLQVLEGDRAAVTQTFEIVATDLRHRYIVLVGVKPIAARQFGAWPMAYAGNSECFDALCARLGMGEMFDPSRMTGDQVASFVLELVSNERQSKRPRCPTAQARAVASAACMSA